MRTIKLVCITIIYSSISALPNCFSQTEIEKITFWDRPKKGANIFNKYISRKDIKTAKNYGIKFIRLSPDKFPAMKSDFLIGDANNYKAILKEDLIILQQVLNMFEEERMPVVLTMLSLPGSRWKQNNNEKDDLRLWNSLLFQEQAATFWQDLALYVRKYHYIVGYNILNEPHPERLYDKKNTHIDAVNQIEVQQKLFDFYNLVIKKIREVDPHTPIILDSSAYADPKTFKNFKPHKDSNILYSFHMYEPYEYTNNRINNGIFEYPGKIKNIYWDHAVLKNYMQDVIKFQQANFINSNKVLVGEFGGHRTSKGLSNYFKDLLGIFNERHWHFAFYAFREDTWDGMDYELGSTKLTWAYWAAKEKGLIPILNRKCDYEQIKILIDDLKKS